MSEVEERAEEKQEHLFTKGMTLEEYMSKIHLNNNGE